MSETDNTGSGFTATDLLGRAPSQSLLARLRQEMGETAVKELLKGPIGEFLPIARGIRDRARTAVLGVP